MGIFSARRKTRSRDRPGNEANQQRAFQIWGAIFNAKVRKELSGSEAVYSAVSQICNTLACMPLHLYKDHEVVTDDPREKCVSWAPNGSMTPFNLKLAVEACRDTLGTAYIMVVPGEDGVTPAQLDPLDPTRVIPLRNTETQEIWYRITLDDGRTVTVHNCYVIALHHMSTDGVTGISPIEVLGGTLNYDRKIQEISLSQLEGITDSIVLTYPTSLGPELCAQRTKEFLEAYRSSRGHVIVLEGGVTAEKITSSMVDPKVLDVNNITKRNVAAVYNMPPRMLGDVTVSGYSTSEQDLREFLVRTILPIVRQWEEALNRKLLTYKEYSEGYAFRFDMDALNRGDTDAMANKHQKLVRSGSMKPNEARKENGLPPDPYGDMLFISRDLIPVKVAVEHPELLLGGKMSETPMDNKETA